MCRSKGKPELVIAGPGAGKTFNMVNRICVSMLNLESHRFLVAITYTNAATEVILSRLKQKVHIQPNVFIGTNHRFLNRFILIPYATLFGRVALDKLFLEINVDKIVEKIIVKQYGKAKKKEFPLRRKIRSNLIRNLLSNGTVPFEQIAKVSAILMKDAQIREMVAYRIQYMFIDEFQDTDRTQLEIFEHIRKAGHTKMYVVGDPEQYISGFTYRGTGTQIPKFNSIPFHRFSKTADIQKNENNHRSHEEIVKFINQFHTEVNQTSVKGGSIQAGVSFISDTDLDTIIGRFKNTVKSLGTNNDQGISFYLSKENKTFTNQTSRHNLVLISNDQVGHRSLLNEALSALTATLELNQRQILDKYELDQVDFRTIGVKFIEAVMAKKINDEADLAIFIQNELCPSFIYKNNVYAAKLLLGLKNLLSQAASVSHQHRFTSIHKAKGLEADAVLAVAKSEKELLKWLTTNKTKRCEDLNDDCRVGYVAFSRAKSILCIACLKPISKETKDTMMALGVAL